MGGFLVGRDAEAAHLDEARVHPFVEQVDRLALARAFHARDQDEDGEALLLAQLALRLEQGAAQLRLLLTEVFLAHLVVEFGRFEHGASILPRASGRALRGRE